MSKRRNKQNNVSLTPAASTGVEHDLSTEDFEQSSAEQGVSEKKDANESEAEPSESKMQSVKPEKEEPMPKEVIEAPQGMVGVKAKVNMQISSVESLVVGKLCFIKEATYKMLCADERQVKAQRFFEE